MELRWLQLREWEIPDHPSAIPVAGTGYALVLQVRKREGPRGESWWDEWQDIPIHAE